MESRSVEEEDDLLKEPLDGWSETEGEWRMAVKMKGQEVPGGKELEGQESQKVEKLRSLVVCTVSLITDLKPILMVKLAR